VQTFVLHLPVSTSEGGGFLETTSRRRNVHSVLDIAAVVGVVSTGASVFLDEWLLAANLGMTHY
jgi:hypothetical protein